MARNRSVAARVSAGVRGLGAPLLATAALGLVACSAASPMLLEPRAPAVGELRLQGGGAALVPVAGDTGAISAARTTQTTGSDAPAKLAAGVAEATLIHPGVAPVVRAQIGAAPGLEASLRYGGRDLGLGARWIAYESRTDQGGVTALSIGLEGRALLHDRPSDGLTPPAVSVTGERGFGGALPIALSWSSDAGLVSAYVGAMVGADYASGTVGGEVLSGSASYRRWFGGGTVGLGVGFRRVRALIELGLERDFLHAEIAGQAVDLRLWSLTPAFALSIRL